MQITSYSEKKALRPFAVFDLDGTLIRWQLYHSLADQFVELGFSHQNNLRETIARRKRWQERDEEISFRHYELGLIKEFDHIIAGLNHEQYNQAVDAVFEQHKNQVYVFTRNLAKQLKGDGYVLLAISGSPIEIVEKIADYYGFDDCLGSVYERTKQGFNGEKTVVSWDKSKALQSLIKKHYLSIPGSVGIGDTYSDVGMLQHVERPIAFNPDQKLYEHAKTQGWQIIIERKNVIYELNKDNDGRYQLA